MKNIFVLTIFLASNAWAVPHNVYLASPKRIEVIGNKVALSFDLKCKNEDPDNWAGHLINVFDDSGDLEVGLAIVLSKDVCKPGPLKEFTFRYPLTRTGVTAEDLNRGVTLVPMHLAQ